MRLAEYKICPECKISFYCGGQCWCNNYPPIMPVEPNNGCYCQACFHKMMVQTIQEIMKGLTQEMRLKIKALPKANNLIDGIDYTINSNGDREFTKWYLIRNE